MPNWGTAVGFIAKWLNPLIDPVSRLDRKLEKVNKEIEDIDKEATSPEMGKRLSAAILKRSGLQRKRQQTLSRQT